MCCWEWKPRYFCAWCRMPLFWHPRPGRLEPCLSSKMTGGCVVGNCVERKVKPVESASVYTGCCVDCARLVGRGKVPAYYRDAEPPLEKKKKKKEKEKEKEQKKEKEEKRVVSSHDDGGGEDDNYYSGDEHVKLFEKWVDYDGGAKKKKKKGVKSRKVCVIL